MKQTTINIRDLSIGYPDKHGTKLVASHIQAQINSGELTCLLGTNGVGKSTLLRTLSAFQAPIDGEIEILGRPLSQYDDKRLATLIGVVLTEKCDIRNMTSEELIGLGRSPYTGFWGTLKKKDKEAVQEAIELVNIRALAQRMVHTLSDGERQKVMIAKALAQQTPIILLDEPTAFLDFPSKIDMLKLLKHLAHRLQKTILLSTHDLAFALKMADNLWLMQAGKLHEGTPKQLADTGLLANYIHQKDVTFNPQTMDISYQSKVDI